MAYYRVLMHAAVAAPTGRSRSKYKGGFVNGKNTSAYNHDYYIHNKEKWGVTRSTGTSDFQVPDELTTHSINSDDLIDFMMSQGWDPKNIDEYKQMLEALANSNYLSDEERKNFYAYGGWDAVPDSDWKELFDEYTEQAEFIREDRAEQQQEIHSNLQSASNRPSAYSVRDEDTIFDEYGNSDIEIASRPHGRKRGETTASGKVKRRIGTNKKKNTVPFSKRVNPYNR